jgi:mitochondrial fission protein ELM1
MTITAWAVTTGETGMRTQARGLAEALADEVTEIEVGRVWPWRRTLLSSPWPDIMVSCGRRSARWALSAKRKSGRSILAVHVQDPRRDADAFDFVVAMDHDAIVPSARVLKVATALHDLTPAKLDAAAAAWRERLAPLGRPLTGVAIGGSLRGREFTTADGARLIEGLRRVKDGTGGALAITPSRRTPAAVLDQLTAAFGGDPRVFLWDLTGDNPYRAILAAADRLVVTSDSVSMVSEALAAPHPVEVLDLGFGRHAGFIQNLVDRRLIRRFEGDPTPPATTGPVNATLEAAAAVKALYPIRTGVSG